MRRTCTGARQKPYRTSGSRKEVTHVNARLFQLLVVMALVAAFVAKAKWQVGFFDGH
jgi:hypothetical protein